MFEKVTSARSSKVVVLERITQEQDGLVGSASVFAALHKTGLWSPASVLHHLVFLSLSSLPSSNKHSLLLIPPPADKHRGQRSPPGAAKRHFGLFVEDLLLFLFVL